MSTQRLLRQINKLYRLGLSQAEIGVKLGIKPRLVSYLMNKHSIPRRSRSEATYVKRNPGGDPFTIKHRLTPAERELKGFGLGLYWGEGTRRDKSMVRLGNTDPEIIKKFLTFLERICAVKTEKLRFGLQVFNDGDPQAALDFWLRELDASAKQFQKVVVTPTRGVGSYRYKIQHGVLTVYYCNKRLRDLLIAMLK